MTIVCLGWGSLIWRPEALPLAGDWQPDGPLLPIEFARESGDRRITLVITKGARPLRTLWAPLVVKTMAEARRALADREGIAADNMARSIGGWSASDISEDLAVSEWAAAKGLTDVVWTALKPKFGKEYRVPSSAEVLAHLNALQGSDRERAEQYVRMTPRQITSTYRAVIEGELGWTPMGPL
jgi:hypothetical protein